MRGLSKDSILGRCTFCKYTVREDEEKFPSHYAKITYGRWICGSCLLGMSNSVTDAQKGYESGAAERAKILNKIGYRMDPKTGKLIDVKKK